jgi:sec-independent protein translocase protein TatA
MPILMTGPTCFASSLPLAIFSLPSGPELFVILIVGLLIFGGRLPEVARSIARGIQDFKRGLADLDREVKQPMREIARIAPPAHGGVPYEPARKGAGIEPGEEGPSPATPGAGPTPPPPPADC